MRICGIDEVGRGPLAGPVVAASVLLEDGHGIEGLADSKKLSEKKRELLVPVIEDRSLAWGLGWVWPETIDEINIHRASLLAMSRAFDDMMNRLKEGGSAAEVFSIKVDGKYIPDLSPGGNYSPELQGEIEALIKGDSLVNAISAASIIAKVRRDHWMVEYAKKEPRYGFDRHKGYPTRAHKLAIQEHGPSAIQRMSFRFEL